MIDVYDYQFKKNLIIELIDGNIIYCDSEDVQEFDADESDIPGAIDEVCLIISSNKKTDYWPISSKNVQTCIEKRQIKSITEASN